MKRVLAVTLSLLSIFILLISGFQNKSYKANKISAEIIEGDIKILDKNKYFMDSNNFADTTRLSISNEGFENSIYSNIFGLSSSYEAFNFEFENNKNYSATNLKHSGISSTGEAYSMISKYLSQGDQSYLDINLLSEGTKEQNIKVNYKDIFENDEDNSSNYAEVMAVDLNDNELLVLLTASTFINNENATSYKLLKIKLSDENVTIKDLNLDKNEAINALTNEGNMPQMNFALLNDRIYILMQQNSMRTTILAIDANNISNFEIIYDRIVDEVYNLDREFVESFIQENKFENRMEVIKVFSDGSINVLWIDMKTNKVNEFEDIRAFDENISSNFKIDNIQINQVFTTGNDIFINYSSDVNNINSKNNLKFIDLETSKIELFIETNLNNTKVGKLIN